MTVKEFETNPPENITVFHPHERKFMNFEYLWFENRYISHNMGTNETIHFFLSVTTAYYSYIGKYPRA